MQPTWSEKIDKVVNNTSARARTIRSFDVVAVCITDIQSLFLHHPALTVGVCKGEKGKEQRFSFSFLFCFYFPHPQKLPEFHLLQKLHKRKPLKCEGTANEIPSACDTYLYHHLRFPETRPLLIWAGIRSAVRSGSLFGIRGDEKKSKSRNTRYTTNYKNGYTSFNRNWR